MAESTSSTDMFGPLSFAGDQPSEELECPLCDDTFSYQLAFHIFLQHLVNVHKLVIEDVQNIHKLPSYLKYYRDRFAETPMEQFVPSLKVDENDRNAERYFLLSNLTDDDKDLRQRLRLEHVLDVQEFERTSTDYMNVCTFCKINYEGTRQGFVEHLSTDHNLQLGNPQNLVFIEEMIDKIDRRLTNHICIYCQKVFPEWFVLKEHMRKKIHKRINYRDKEFDKHFVVKYVDPKSASSTHNTNDPHEDDRMPDEQEPLPNADEEFSDWQDKPSNITCLFCDEKSTEVNALCLHMDAEHDFDFVLLTADLDFYQKVKLINYVRKKVHNKVCIGCGEKYEGCGELQRHQFQEKHCKMPPHTEFDSPEYFFPTYEDDAFLYHIDEMTDDGFREASIDEVPEILEASERRNGDPEEVA